MHWAAVLKGNRLVIVLTAIAIGIIIFRQYINLKHVNLQWRLYEEQLKKEQCKAWNP